LERESIEFENILEEGESPSPCTMASEEEMVEIFEFPILESNGETKMKNINPSTLPHFHGILF
jgi:hypothetical protein